MKEYLVYRMRLLVHSIPVSSSSISLREQSDDFSEGRGGAGRGSVTNNRMDEQDSIRTLSAPSPLTRVNYGR